MTHDFLQPLGRMRKSTPGPKGTPETVEKEATKQHVLPSGISADSVRHMGPEFRKRSSGRKTAEGTSPETPKMASDNGKAPGSSSRNTDVGSCAGFYGDGAFTLWQEMGGGGGGGDKRAERSPWIGMSQRGSTSRDVGRGRGSRPSSTPQSDTPIGGDDFYDTPSEHGAPFHHTSPEVLLIGL